MLAFRKKFSSPYFFIFVAITFSFAEFYPATVLPISFSANASTITTSTSNNSNKNSNCGKPLIDAWAHLQIPQPKELDLNDPDHALDQISALNVKRLKKSLIPLLPHEEDIFKRIQEEPFFITHRLPLDRLRSILKNGHLYSPQRAIELGMLPNVFTPSLENNLFGGFDCVFAAVGPKNGRNYGNVTLRISLKDLPTNTWATLSSGFFFLKKIRPIETENVDDFDRIQFALTVSAIEDWTEYFSLMVVGFIRQNDPNHSKHFADSLLNKKTREDFWQFIDENRLGYLEAKIPENLSLDNVSSIEVPSENLNDVCAWPDSKSWLKKLGCQN